MQIAGRISLDFHLAGTEKLDELLDAEFRLETVRRVVHLRGYRLGKDLLGSFMRLKIQSGLGMVGIDDLKGLPVDVQAHEDADFLDSGKGFMQLVEAAGAEVTDQNIEEPHVPEGFPEPVKQRGTWFIGKKCQVVLHGSVLFVSFT